MCLLDVELRRALLLEDLERSTELSQRLKRWHVHQVRGAKLHARHRNIGIDVILPGTHTYVTPHQQGCARSAHLSGIRSSETLRMSTGSIMQLLRRGDANDLLHDYLRHGCMMDLLLNVQHEARDACHFFFFFFFFQDALLWTCPRRLRACTDNSPGGQACRLGQEKVAVNVAPADLHNRQVNIACCG